LVTPGADSAQVTTRRHAARLRNRAVAETILVYAVVPLAIVAVMALFTLRPDPKARRRRYRPGQPWQHEPVWYSPHGSQPAAHAVHGELASGDSHRAALPSGAPVAGRGGPLGGARGTW
jgi:hypothetical protein